MAYLDDDDNQLPVLDGVDDPVDGLMKTSNLATPLQVLDNTLEGEIGLMRPLFDYGEILGVLGQGQLDCLIDQVRHAAIGFRSLQSQARCRSSSK